MKFPEENDIRNQYTQFSGNRTKSISKQQILAIVNRIYDSLGFNIPIYSKSEDTYDKKMGL